MKKAFPVLPPLRLACLLLLLMGSTLCLQAATDFRVELLTENRVVVRWSVSDGDWAIEQADALGVPPSWLGVDELPAAEGVQRSVTLVRSAATRFFRLRSTSGAGLLSSDELIARAVESAAITEETALLYRVFVLFKDPRLPSAYKGNDAGVDAAGAFDLALEQWPSLSESARATLTPFLATTPA